MLLTQSYVLGKRFMCHSQFTATFYFNAEHQFDLKWTYYAFPYFTSYTVTVLDAHTEHDHGVSSFPTIGSVWCKGMSLCGLLRHSIRAFSDWLHVVAAIIWSSRGWASSLICLFVIWDSTQLVVIGCILVLFLYKSKVAVLKLNHRPVSTTSNINGGTCLYLVYLERNRFAIPSDLSQWVDILLHRLNWRHQLMSDHRPGPRLWSNTFKGNTATSVEMVAVIFVLLWSPSTVA